MKDIDERKTKLFKYKFVFLAALSMLISCRTPPKSQPELVIEVVVEELIAGDEAEIQIIPDTQETARELEDGSISLPAKTISNGEHIIEIAAIPDGAYEIIIAAQTSYYHEPKGYIFRIENDQIIRKHDNRFPFRLISPSQQSLLPCREEIDESPAVIKTGLVENELGALVPEEMKIECRAEYLIDVSAPPKRGEQPYRQVVGTYAVQSEEEGEKPTLSP